MRKRLSVLGRILGGLFILMIVGLVGLIGYTLFWEQQQRERLAEGSVLIETDQGVIEYAEFGSGPAVLTIHGSPGGYDGGGDGEFWSQAGFRYISPSRPGYLRTPLTVGKTFEEQADAYAALLDALAIDKVAIVAGSGGGPSALQFALRHPERCSSLVLISAITQRREFTEAERIAINIEATSLIGWLFTTIITQKPEWVFPSLDPSLAPNGDPNQYDDYVAITLGSLPMGPRQEGWLNDFEQMGQMPTYPLAEITCPTLIVHGLEDVNAPLSGAEYAATTIPNAKLLKIEGGHLALITQMDEVMPKIADFVELHRP
jgi:pimeloyl-ACP methyl ester carboxylesterase